MLVKGVPSMSLEEARGQLGVQDEDIALIRRTKDPNWLFRFILGAIVSIASFVVGYAVGSDSESSYPYSSIVLASAAGAGRRKVPWVLLIVLPVLAFFCFGAGVFAAHPTYGEEMFGRTIEYNVYSGWNDEIG